MLLPGKVSYPLSTCSFTQLDGAHRRQDQMGRNALYYALGNQVPDMQWEILQLEMKRGRRESECGLSTSRFPSSNIGRDGKPLLFRLYSFTKVAYGMLYLLVDHQYSLVNKIGLPHKRDTFV